MRCDASSLVVFWWAFGGTQWYSVVFAGGRWASLVLCRPQPAPRASRAVLQSAQSAYLPRRPPGLVHLPARQGADQPAQREGHVAARNTRVAGCLSSRAPARPLAIFDCKRSGRRALWRGPQADGHADDGARRSFWGRTADERTVPVRITQTSTTYRGDQTPHLAPAMRPLRPAPTYAVVVESGRDAGVGALRVRASGHATQGSGADVMTERQTFRVFITRIFHVNTDDIFVCALLFI